MGRLDIRLETTVLNNTVTVNGLFGVRDWSGDWDDQYDGTIDFVIVAELEPAGQAPPRGDLTITGVEFNQAVQYFRSNRFLDPVNVRPDNSVFLIARKNTGVRVYVDWDNTAGLPAISNLSGELVVNTGSTSVTLSPINPGQAIVPKRDANINQALANDTLNFMIPAAFSAGTVTVSCEVFDQAAPDLRSGAFTRTLVFVPVDPLNIFLVGVALQNPATAAPTQAQISSALSMLISTYPRGDILQTGFTTVTDSGQFTGAAPSSGCGSGWGDLVDSLQDLRGGSDDIYFGGLPAGVACVASVLGCSPTGHGVAAGFLDVLVAMPHEIGHALNRHHAKCVGCTPATQNPDPDFPQYNGFNSDSIGVFGFDPTTNTVFNPASTLDFMSRSVGLVCSGNTVTSASTRWISPYTYQALLGGTVGAPRGALLHSRRPIMILFLGLEIARDRTVTRRYSFHYDAPLQGRSDCETPFTFEFLDEKRNVIDCGPLHCRCTGDCRCWPKVTRDALPFPDNARWLLIWEGDEQIYEEKIPDPPKVWIVSAKAGEDGIELTWDSEPGEDLCYMVHWFDRRHGARRGVAPRLKAKSLLIPKRLFTSDPELHVRVYATSGIATGYDDSVLKLDNPELQRPQMRLQGERTGIDGPQQILSVLSLIAADAAGRQLSADYISWYDASGNQLARGSQLDLRSLPVGRHVVRAVARGFGEAIMGKSWLVERSSDGCLLHHVICDPPPKRTHEEHEHPHPPPPSYEGEGDGQC